MDFAESLQKALTLPKTLYIDPSAVTIAASSIVTAVIVIGAAVIIWWRKTKRKVAKALHIDENAHKEVEEDLVINEESAETEQKKTDA